MKGGTDYNDKLLSYNSQITNLIQKQVSTKLSQEEMDELRQLVGCLDRCVDEIYYEGFGDKEEDEEQTVLESDKADQKHS